MNKPTEQHMQVCDLLAMVQGGRSSVSQYVKLLLKSDFFFFVFLIQPCYFRTGGVICYRCFSGGGE